jgi:DNA-binding XRE family transcriptional regulator
MPLHQKQHSDSFVSPQYKMVMDINIKIGDRIRELRKEKELSQEALANIAEVDRTYMTKVETGKRNVTVKILEKIIVALDSDFMTFFNDNNFKK